jgi:hypothetical protein
MNIAADIDNVGQITIVGAQADISTTATSRGYAFGIFDESPVPQVDVIGGRFRTSGGGYGTVDFEGHVPGTRIHLYGVDHQTRISSEAGGINVQAGDLKMIRASDSADLGKTTVTRFHLAPTTTRPASCAAGDVRVLPSGTYCFCTNPGTPGTWTRIGNDNCN